VQDIGGGGVALHMKNCKEKGKNTLLQEAAGGPAFVLKGGNVRRENTNSQCSTSKLP